MATLEGPVVRKRAAGRAGIDGRIIAIGGIRKGIAKVSTILVATYFLIQIIHHVLSPADYRAFPVIGSRTLVWVIAQWHLMFGAFVLGVPIFVLITEIIGKVKGSRRFDDLAKEFTRLLAVSYTLTAVLGAALLVALFALYPRFLAHLSIVFKPSWIWYVAMILMEAFFAYLYWYSWEPLRDRKGWHIFIGVMVNLFGIIILFVTSSWVGYTMTPQGVEGRDLAITVIDRWKAGWNYALVPLFIHRFIANICFGGAIAGAYAAFRFLSATTDEERAKFDWMGYIGSFIAVSAFIPLPFAGYYFGTEIYHYSQQMGVSMMGGSFAQLWYIQAIVLIVIATGFAVWATPRSIIASVAEMRAMGGAHHPKLGVLGVMSAKNTAVNMMILFTFINFMLYRRGNKETVVPWATIGKAVQLLLLLVASGIVIGYGVYGYFVPAAIRIGFSVYQVLAVLGFMITFFLIEVPLYKGARSLGDIQWGKMPHRSQYVLFFLAVTFTWLMGLMGYIRSGIRQYWHVYGVMRDTSPGAFIPTHGAATATVSMIVFLFFLMIAAVFALALRSERKEKLGS